MEEKILVKSEQYDVKKLCKTLVKVGLILYILGTIISYISSCSHYIDVYSDHEHSYSCYKWEYYDYYYDDLHGDGLKESRMDCPVAEHGNPFTYAIGDYFTDNGFIFSIIPLAALALISGLIYLWLRSYELTITDKRVFGKVAWGKRVDLPLDSVSAVGTGAFKSITISTSSGKVGFSAVKNRNEIHKIVSNLLVERQKQTTASAQTITPTSATGNADELKKYKDLLDAGIITQEEFDAKKKQLLGL